MLKGKSVIELTDINTGKVEIFENDNMVTNAIADILKPMGAVKDPNILYNSFSPYYQKLLGGILLFDKYIDENPDNYFAPGDAKMIGCGVYNMQNSTTGLCRGNFNIEESEINEDERFVKYVYDYSTSQANGTIASVCLTHANGGYDGYGSVDAVPQSGIYETLAIDSNSLQYVNTYYTGANTGDKATIVTLGVTELIFLIDRNNEIVYYFRIDSASQITIIKRKAYLKSVSILDSIYYTKPLVDEITLTLEEPLVSTNTATGTATTSNITYNFDNTDNCLYIFASSGTTLTANNTFQMIKIELETWEITYYTIPNATGVTINTTASWRTAYTSHHLAFAHNGFIIVKSNTSPFQPYKIEIKNPANVTEIKLQDGMIFQGICTQANNNRIEFSYLQTRSYTINLNTNEVLYNGRVSANTMTSTGLALATPILDEQLYIYWSRGGTTTSSSLAEFEINTNYLATINNLSEPVTKTADKTMKITYTLQEI